MANSLTPAGDKTVLLKWIVGIFVVVFLANCYTPLRLHVDTLRYFAIKDCIELGCPPDSTAAQDYLPFGYTALLLALSKIGLLKSWAIVFLNCVFLFVSLYLIAKMFQKSANMWVYLLLVFLNWTTIKFVAHPLSEMQYLFFSIASLYLFDVFARTRNFLALGASVLLAGLAFLVRSVGVTLVAGLVVATLWEYRKELIAFVQRNKILVGGLVVVCLLVLIFSRQLGLNHYLGVFTKQFDEGVAASDVFRWHMIEISEMTFNLPFTKVAAYFPVATRIVFVGMGVVLAIGMGWILYRQRHVVPVVVSAYLFFYSVLIFTWPFYDPRFWVPVFPLCAVIIAGLPPSLFQPAWMRLTTMAAASAYCVLGIAAVAYFTYTSYSKPVLASTQAGGSYQKEYEYVFKINQANSTVQPDAAAVSVLERYSE